MADATVPGQFGRRFSDYLRIADDMTRTQRESNKSLRIGKMLATITNPFGPSA